MLHTVRGSRRHNSSMVYAPSGQQGLRSSLEEIYQRRDLVQLTAGCKVPLLRNHVWLVTRGMVKLSCMNELGDDLLLGLAGPNEIFGEPLTNIDLYEATVVADCDLLCLSMEEIEATPHLAISLVRAMTTRMRQSEAMIALLGLRRVEERVRGFLELLAQDYGQPCEQGLMLSLRLTHQDIANALSTTRVTVTRVLGLLREEGWLQLDQQRQLVVSHLPRS